MGEKPKYTIADIYQGGYSTLSPSYGDIFTGYRSAVSNIGITTDPRVADVLTEVSQKIAPGAKVVELSMVSPEIFESVPKQHLKEVKRLAKLTGVDVSVHAPVVEPSGVGREGFSEAQRQAVERQMKMAIERSHEIDSKGNIPVTFHSSAVLPGPEIIKTKEGEEIQKMLVINQESGSINQIQLKERHFPGEEKPDIQKELKKINEDSWRQALSHLAYNTERASEYMGHSVEVAIAAEAEKKAGKEISPEEKRATMVFNAGTAILEDSYRELKEIYEIAHKYAIPEEKKFLGELNKKIKNKVEQINKEPNMKKSILLRQQILEDGLETFNRLSVPPETYKPLNEFSEDKTTTTFANVAFESYKKFGEKAPIICIENPPAGGAFARGEELKDIVEETRKKFVEKAVKEEGISRGEAKEQAERLIGVTWDVGHINMLRKHGFEEKDIIKEAEHVAPLVKHVHLSDNFGFEHTELPMGMGNVPLKEMMKKLGKEGFEAKKIVEAASWWQHFKTSPVAESLKAMGSPIYSMQLEPYWNQAVGFQQGYFSGMGEFLPQVNYETFGGGFSQLPTELGGQRAGGAGARMGGRPME